MTEETARIAALRIDKDAPPAATPEAEQERNIAIFDLLEGNHFNVLAENAPIGPYDVTLIPRDRQIVFSVKGKLDAVTEIMLPATAFRKRAKAYLGICESYFDAVRHSSPDEIARLDEGRKALHNEGADALREKLAEQVDIDTNTARRLFTLVCALSWRG